MLKAFIKDVSKNSISHGAIPFWSWTDKLEESELRRQIQNMYDMGMKGFFMHARMGLETEYMSDEWYDAINASIDEARKLGMEAWSYDAPLEMMAIMIALSIQYCIPFLVGNIRIGESGKYVIPP